MSDISSERTFLHDMASPLATAIFLMDALIEDLSARKDSNPGELEQARTIFIALESMQKLLQERREVVIRAQIKPDGKTGD